MKPPSPQAGVLLLEKALPPLPSVVRYFDDFAEQLISICDFANSGVVVLSMDGARHLIDFTCFGPAEFIIKHVFVDWLHHHDPHTVRINHQNIRSYAGKYGFNALSYLIISNYYDVRSHWNLYILPNVTPDESWSLRALLHSLCRLNIGHWTVDVAPLVRSLTSPKVDKYRVVRVGDCFLPLDQQALIVNHIDETCGALTADPASVPDQELRNTCMLVMAYQYAFRPGQIARVDSTDVRLYSTGAVHVAAPLIKQRGKQKRKRVNRRIKREWGPLFAELVRRRADGRIDGKEGIPLRLLFGLTPQAVSRSLTELIDNLTGEPWTPTDLRHTAAQRLADGGISHVGLTEFMGHTSHRIANVYFDKSPSQAQRINEALAISPIYANVAKVAKTRTIDMAMLLGLPPDKQIGAVPHGIPIAGIGGCELGQSLCIKNPVLACYTCSKFMPVSEAAVHQQVLSDLRPVVIEFAAASRNNQQSPAYAQLKSTLDAVRRVAEELSSDDEAEGEK